ncbi:MAG: ABC transporter substrate-binding protein [Methanomicrobiaceae archaeon]|nr:ABC transporter substrate-binding protein [Methanomicrobiaceae archaeon]
MIQEQQKKIIFALSAVIIIAVCIAGISLSANNTDSSQSPEIVQEQSEYAGDLFTDKSYPEYATGYTIEYHGNFKVVQVNDPWGRISKDLTYLLVPKGEDVPAGYPNARVISIPVDSVISLSVAALPHLKELGEASSIKGHNGIYLVYDEYYHKLAGGGKILEIGSGAMSMETQLNVEQMIELEPDLVFCSATNMDDYDNRGKLEEAGLTPAIVADWMENDPLGRAEWIKFFAAFYNKEKTANEYFDRIKENYTAIKEKAGTVETRPTIFSGFDYQGIWYAPGGESYVAKLFSDAGGDYIYGDNEEAGSLTLDFESVYDQAEDVDFWLNTGYGDDSGEILAYDDRYSKFKAYKTGNIYTYNLRVNDYGGNDYWQSGLINPDVVLADLVRILHPELLPDHKLYYYQNICESQGGESA